METKRHLKGHTKRADEAIQLIAAFYVDGTTIGGTDITHDTPWDTIEEAQAAALEYLLALNTWWATDHPEELYLDPDADVITDLVHAGPVRAGVLPNILDNPPSPPMGAVQIPWGDGTAWLSPP